MSACIHRQKRGAGWTTALWIAGLVLVLVGPWVYYELLMTKTMIGADRAELLSTWFRWKEARMPIGAELQKWLEGRRRDLQVHTNAYVLNNKTYSSILAFTNPRVGRGLMTVTTNGIIIWIDEGRAPRIIDSPEKE